jgi:hypothetical protein
LYKRERHPVNVKTGSGRLQTMQTAGPNFRVSDSVGIGWSWIRCIFNKFWEGRDATDAADLGPRLRQPLIKSTLWNTVIFFLLPTHISFEGAGTSSRSPLTFTNTVSSRKIYLKIDFLAKDKLDAMAHCKSGSANILTYLIRFKRLVYMKFSPLQPRKITALH